MNKLNNKPRREKKMKQFIQTICIITLIAGFIFGGPRPRLKTEIRKDIMKLINFATSDFFAIKFLFLRIGLFFLFLKSL